jgi:hypothetical protein
MDDGSSDPPGNIGAGALEPPVTVEVSLTFAVLVVVTLSRARTGGWSAEGAEGLSVMSVMVGPAEFEGSGAVTGAKLFEGATAADGAKLFAGAKFGGDAIVAGGAVSAEGAKLVVGGMFGGGAESAPGALSDGAGASTEGGREEESGVVVEPAEAVSGMVESPPPVRSGIAPFAGSGPKPT